MNIPPKLDVQALLQRAKVGFRIAPMLSPLLRMATAQKPHRISGLVGLRLCAAAKAWGHHSAQKRATGDKRGLSQAGQLF